MAHTLATQSSLRDRGRVAKKQSSPSPVPSPLSANRVGTPMMKTTTAQLQPQAIAQRQLSGSNHQSATKSNGSFPFSTASPLIRHDPRCACGGVCPRCQNRIASLALSPLVQRTPIIQRSPGPDPLCPTFDFATTKGLASAHLTNYQATQAVEQKLQLIRSLKPIRRCATAEQQAQTQKDLKAVLDVATADAIWTEAGTSFGGYAGMYPGYASDVKHQLEQLGTSETLSFGTFKLTSSGASHRKGAKRVASAEVPALARTDIVYFRGHQFAQYRAPGLFSDGSETYGFDLRYIDQAGGFPNVKLMISTSCATLCQEAFDVFHNLFPNAVILGYRKSAPLEGGKVRNTLKSKIKALSRPLILEESVDITAVISAWKSTIEERHKGDQNQLPGFYDGSLIHYWDGAAWQTISPADKANKCKRKGDFRGQYPAPP